MGKNQESQRLEQETTSLPADLSEPAELLAQPVITERRLFIVHNQNSDKGTGLGFSGLAPGSGASRRGRGMLDRAQQARLGKLLRAIFSDVEEDPVPQRFVKLLEALEAQEKKALESKAAEAEAPETATSETREKSGA